MGTYTLISYEKYWEKVAELSSCFSTSAVKLHWGVSQSASQQLAKYSILQKNTEKQNITKQYNVAKKKKAQLRNSVLLLSVSTDFSSYKWKLFPNSPSVPLLSLTAMLWRCISLPKIVASNQYCYFCSHSSIIFFTSILKKTSGLTLQDS